MLTTTKIAATDSKLRYEPGSGAAEGDAIWLPARNTPETDTPGFFLRDYTGTEEFRTVEDLRRKGYARVRSDEFYIRDAMLDAMRDFLESYDRLSVDPHRTNGEQDRRRAFQPFVFLGDELYSIPAEAYEPKYREAQNQYMEGKPRVFAPIEEQIVEENIFLRRAIRIATHLTPFDFRQYPMKVKVQQIRIIARPDVEGIPTPEGVHHDGEDYIAVFLMKKTALGGQASIFDIATKRVLDQVELRDSLDAYILQEGNSPTIEHGVSPIVFNPEQYESDDQGPYSVRDILIVNMSSSPAARVELPEELRSKGPRVSCAWHDVHLGSRARFPNIGSHIKWK